MESNRAAEIATPAEPPKLLSALQAASEWIGGAAHGDNCFVSDHYPGDPGNRCNCGKDSIEEYIDGVIERATQSTTPVPAETPNAPLVPIPRVDPASPPCGECSLSPALREALMPATEELLREAAEKSRALIHALWQQKTWSNGIWVDGLSPRLIDQIYGVTRSLDAALDASREGSNPKGECPPGPRVKPEEPGHEVARPKESGE